MSGQSRPNWTKASRVRFSIGVLFVVHFLLFWLPGLHGQFLSLPPREELKKSDGELGFVRVRRGYVTVLRSASGELKFTCKAIYGDPDCFSAEERHQYSGKMASIYWHELRVFPFPEFKRVAIVVVGKKEIQSLEESKRYFELSQQSAQRLVLSTLAEFVIVVLVLIYWEKK